MLIPKLSHHGSAPCTQATSVYFTLGDSKGRKEPLKRKAGKDPSFCRKVSLLFIPEEQHGKGSMWVFRA